MSPDSSVGIPIKRAPTRFMAVARKALPIMERPKNKNSNTTSTSVTPSTTSDCPVICSPPSSKRASENAGVREPSAPKNSKPRPTSTPCSATETISSVSTVASASGRNARRYSSGPRGVINTTVVSAWVASDAGFKPSTRALARPGSSTHHTSAEVQSTAAPFFQRQASTTSTLPARASSSHKVAGVRPACSMAIDSAPKATNSPCGMKMTRVTEKTSTSARAISPYTAPLTSPSCASSRAICASMAFLSFL